MSSLTNFLKLFKWDTKIDGSQKFNVDKALNENWDKVDTYLKDMEIGGRNYLLNSKPNISNSNYEFRGFYLSEAPIDGETYTISLKGKLGTGKSYFWIFNSYTVELTKLQYDSEKDIYTSTFKWKSTNGSTTVDNSKIIIYTYPKTVTVESSLEWIKLELGNKPTDWSPAPEDINNAIGTLSSLTTTDKTSLVNALNELRKQTRRYMNGESIQYTDLLTERTFDEIMGLGLPSVFNMNGNSTTKDGAGFPTGAYEYGTLLTLNSSAAYGLTQIYVPDYPTTHGFYVRTNTGTPWLHLGGNIVTGEEFKTDEYRNGKQVYKKIVYIGNLPNTGTKDVAHGLTDVSFIKIEGIAKDSTGYYIPLPFPSSSSTSVISLNTYKENISIKTGMDRSGWTGTVDLYYTKNS